NPNNILRTRWQRDPAPGTTRICKAAIAAAGRCQHQYQEEERRIEEERKPPACPFLSLRIGDAHGLPSLHLHQVTTATAPDLHAPGPNSRRSIKPFVRDRKPNSPLLPNGAPASSIRRLIAAAIGSHF